MSSDSSDDAVRAFLRQQRAADHIVEGGFEGLVASWERIAAQAEGGYDLGFDDWLNDLDCRQLLDDARSRASHEAETAMAARIAAADARFRAATGVSEQCLWGADNAAHHGWTPAVNWWYWRTIAVS